MIPTNHRNITKSDSTMYSPPLNGVYVGTAGNLDVESINGEVASYKVTDGSYVIGIFRRVMASTTAADLVGLFAGGE